MKPESKSSEQTADPTIGILTPSKPLVLAGEIRSRIFLLVDSFALKMEVRYLVRIRQVGESGLKPACHFVQVWKIKDSKKTVRETLDLKPDHLLHTKPVMFSDKTAMDSEAKRIAFEFSESF